jgi:hypothetical protein
MSARLHAVVAITALACSLLSGDAAAEDFLSERALSASALAFQAPHVVRAPAASIDAELARQVDEWATATNIATPDDLVAFALGATANLLHFGLGHRTRLSFDPAEREGNCVEYAELFASILHRERRTIPARAWVVRSDARVLGKMLPGAAWKDHDWVLVVARTPDGTTRLYVDPTLYDMGLGWDIAPSVHGDVGLGIAAEPPKI